MKRPLKTACCLGALLISAPVWAQWREYALILEDRPLARTVFSRKELGGKAALERGARIEQAQRTLRQELERRKLRTSGSVKTILNAIFVETDDPGKLQDLPGVCGVAAVPELRHHLNAALDQVKGVQGWWALADAGYARAGAGVKIGIIDTGIDQTHPGFQDPLLTPPAGYPKCSGTDCAFTNSKVIVARSYVRMVADRTGVTDSRPDDVSPRDRQGLGTAAAMIAAGNENTGPLAAISGVAPKAYLGNYKIFGSPGLNDTTRGSALIQALEDAYTDGMDVATVSAGWTPIYAWDDTGAACGEAAGGRCDVLATAVENAVANHGMAVVVSAGNDGEYALNSPALGSVATPGIAPSAVTVGAVRNGHTLLSRVGLTAADAPANLKSVTAWFGDSLRSKVTAPLRRADGDGFACSPLAAGSLAGAVALIQRSAELCDYYTKAVNALNAGAVGVLFYREAGSDAPHQPLGLAGLNAPSAGIGYSDGNALKTYLESHPDAQFALDPALVVDVESSPDTIAPFSSRGPAIGSLRIKPELVAPGTSLYTATQKYDANADRYDPSGYTVVNGTSFSAAMAAGAIALVKQKNPNFTAAQLKSAVVNTANRNVQDSSVQASAAAMGAGRLDVEAAVKTNVTVSPSTLSFGLASQALGGSRQFTVYNASTSLLTLTVEATTPDANAHVQLSTSYVAAGQTETVVAYLAGTMPPAGAYEGNILIQGGAVDLHVPYTYFVPTGALANLLTIQDLGLSQAGQASPLGIALRAVDRYGIGVSGAPVTWTSVKGGVYVDPTPAGGADTQTWAYGVAWANVFPGSNAGDKAMTASVGSTPLAFTFRGSARVAPTIAAGGVVNAASGQVVQAGQGAAPGSYISIWGLDLSDINTDWNTIRAQNVDPTLPVSLAGVSVGFDVPGANLSVPGRLTWAGKNQINVQIPWELSGQGSAVMKVRVGAAASAPYTLYLADRAPGVFEYPLGSGNAAAVDALAGTLITSSTPIAKGRWVSFYVNGLGPVDENVRPGSGEMTRPGDQGLVWCTDTPVVTIGGKTAAVNFAGLTPTGIGYYQINAQVPEDAPSGLQPVTIAAQGVAAKTVNLPIQ